MVIEIIGMEIHYMVAGLRGFAITKDYGGAEWQLVQTVMQKIADVNGNTTIGEGKIIVMSEKEFQTMKSDLAWYKKQYDDREPDYGADNP